jgi:DNA-binding transcriptional MocR family regulator
MPRGQSGTRTSDIMTAIRARIAARSLAAGDRLPSIRSFATTMGVSPSTVVEAYDRLAAEGLIRSQRGSGFYVSNNAMPPLKLAETAPPRARAVDPFWVSRQSLDSEAGMPKPGCGWLPADWMPNEALRRAIRSHAREGDEVLSYYGSTRGSPALRRLLLARLAEDGIDAGMDNLMLTSSGTQALDLICRFVLRPGDTVVIDDPCYFNFQALLKAHQVKIVGVPYTPSGPDIAAFEALLEAERPRAYITNSAIHNPTGATLSPLIAHRLLNATARHEMTVIEDDIFADFEPEPSVRLAALDGLNRVIRVGSFSKSLSASVRCGYIAARRDWSEGLVDLQIATNFGGPSPFATDMIAKVLSGGSYRKHMEDLRRKLVRTRRDVAEHLQRLGIEPWILPRGGFNLWCRLPDGLDSSAVAQAALDKGIVLAPGNVFSVSQNATGFMRFNVAHMIDPNVHRVLAEVLRRTLNGATAA